MLSTLESEFNKPSWQKVLDSVLPGGNNWQTLIDGDGECLKKCPAFNRCKGTGPEKVCSSEWKKAPASEETIEVIFHVMNNFDFYNKGDLPPLSPAVKAIRSRSNQLLIDFQQDITEGSKRLKLHLKTERASSVVAKKLKARAVDSRKVVCDGCKVDYYRKFGVESALVMECHHVVPIGSKGHGGVTRPKDLVLMCANCHRLIHSKKINLNFKKLQVLVTAVPSPAVGRAARGHRANSSSAG